MAGGSVRKTSLWQQTIALLWKNLLLKWRRKWHSVLEWLQNLAYVLLMFIVAAMARMSPHSQLSPYEALGRVNEFKSTNFTVGYVSTMPTAGDIMRRVAESGDLRGLTVKEYEDENTLLNDVENNTAVAVVFHQPFQYHIQFPFDNISSPNDHISPPGECSNSSKDCIPTYYWSKGFLFLQARIDSVIIEMTTNHTVQEKLTSIMVAKMSTSEHFIRLVPIIGMFVFGMCLSYVSMTYLLSLYVTRERMEMSVIMKTMMLKERAFWLSWGLLYLFYILIIANLMTLVTKFHVFIESSYGSIHLENDLEGVFFSDMTGSSSHILTSCVSLLMDSVLYALLTLYFSKILPDKNGMRYEPLFFLRSSYWSKEKISPPRPQTSGRAESYYGENIEKVPRTFQGREVIRIHNVRKTYKGEDQAVEALRGLDFDIYEGQITALLGHSGAGKTTLMNILSGVCSATSGKTLALRMTPWGYKMSSDRDYSQLVRGRMDMLHLLKPRRNCISALRLCGKNPSCENSFFPKLICAALHYKRSGFAAVQICNGNLRQNRSKSALCEPRLTFQVAVQSYSSFLGTLPVKLCQVKTTGWRITTQHDLMIKAGFTQGGFAAVLPQQIRPRQNHPQALILGLASHVDEVSQKPRPHGTANPLR
ncbi:hypothetical protein GDO78_018731 [Eleutherodactylus coqui]|uniref:ABC transporter domain-containing protein n=1 Tax=Eleutherodactylus coqui TaxID=57060 RepID=A0A8J6BHK6_ELECQ|nr:hypothetical protein GDO78_018731 [Eleutherodactylus coqui]